MKYEVGFYSGAGVYQHLEAAKQRASELHGHVWLDDKIVWSSDEEAYLTNKAAKDYLTMMLVLEEFKDAYEALRRKNRSNGILRPNIELIQMLNIVMAIECVVVELRRAWLETCP